jgi:uncharacterized protein (DUF1501 family)
VVDQKLRGDNVQVDAIQPSDGLSSMRLTARRDLLQQFDRQRRLAEQSLSARRLDTYYDRAFSLLSSDRTRQAFQLSEEPASLRARYGDTEFGQRCVLARRLAEAGVPVVNVSYCHTPSGSWDTHSRNFKKLKESLAPTLDSAFSALVNDLDDRGRLDDTLVIVMAEFGRTPKINKNSGRDHWPWVYSFAFAGAGVRPGAVFGASDESAAYPAENPVSPADFAATLYHFLGVPASTMLYDKTNRPHHLVVGKTIDGILA